MAVTFNPSDKGSDIILSNGNLTVTKSNNGNQGVRANISKSSGKWYWEIVIDSIAGSPNPATICIGASTSSGNLSATLGSDTYGWGWYCDYVNKLRYHSGDANDGTAYGSRVYAATDVIGVALDLDGGSIVMYLNNSSQGTMFSISGTVFPHVSIYNGTTHPEQVTGRFLASAFSYTPPSGYGPLDVPASGPANLKTYNTNAKANIKTINTNAIANVKTLDTNA